MSFRKTKRKGRNVRQRITEDEEEENDGDTATAELLQEARKRTKGAADPSTTAARKADDHSTPSSTIAPAYAANATSTVAQQAARNTSVAEHHPVTKSSSSTNTTTTADDGIFRAPTHNAFHAGPLKAPTNIRTTARFDYQQDVCKDYKETGFCGFGDTCIYLHDRGDTLTGWQLEQQWETAQLKKKQAQEKEMASFTNKSTGEASETSSQQEISTEDGIPFACYICRQAFRKPVVTNCSHYFCESCILNHIRTESEACPICGKDTNSVFNEPTKLIAKRRRLLGAQAARADDAWEKYSEAFQKKASS